MALSTIYLYKSEFSSDTSSNAVIEKAIDISSSFIENYCNRSFGAQTYVEYIDGFGQNSILTKEYPINAIYNIQSNLISAIQVNVDSSIYQINITITSTGISVYSLSLTGVQSTNTDTFANSPRISNIVSFLDGLAGVTASTSLAVDLPSIFLRPISLQVARSSSSFLEMFDDAIPCMFTLDNYSNNSIILDRYLPRGIKTIRLNYNAGYTLPVDNGGHTGLTTAGNVPIDLTSLCNRFANVVIKDINNGINSGVYASESLGDYSYSTYNWGSDGIKSSVESFLVSNKNLMDKYKRKVLTWA